MSKELESWFSGGGLADIGMAAAGLTPTVAVELDDAIAGVYRANLGNHCLTADVRNVELHSTPFWFHVSPPCTNASVAKTNGGETELDIELARAIVRGIERRSPWFSLENVWGYRTFESFRLILEALSNNGYNLAYWHLNSASYGVPQTRKRLILCASRVKRVVQPHPTHAKTPDLFALPWVGWYGAIADLVPTLPETQFAKWQLERLPEELRTDWYPRESQSFLTETKFPNRNASRIWKGTGEPTPTITALDQNLKACLVPGGNASSFSLRYQDEPNRTVGDVDRVGNLPRALLIGDQRSNGGRSLSIRNEDQPCYTVEASKSGVHAGRALLIEGTEQRGATVSHRGELEPSFTIKASIHKSSTRAYIPSGRVVTITPECLARFQSVPGWYQLSGRASLDCKVLGNGFPCLLAQALVEAQGL